MISSFFILLPAALAFLMLITYFTRRSKTTTQRLFMMTAVCDCVYMVADACYVTPHLDYTTYLIADILAHYCAPMLIVLAALLLFQMHKPGRKMDHLYWLLVLPVVIGTMTLVPYLVIGWKGSLAYLDAFDMARGFPTDFVDQQAMPQAYFILWLFSTPVYYLISSFGIACLISYVIHCMRVDKHDWKEIFRFVFKGAEMTPFYITCWLTFLFELVVVTRMAMGRQVCLDYPIITVLLSVFLAEIVYDFYYVGLITNMPEGTLLEMLHPRLFAPSTLPDKAGTEAFISEDEDLEIAKRFRQMMLVEKRFLDPHITIEDVANDLGTSRVVIARGVNRVHNLTFREYLNKRRLEEAKQYMLNHPAATQDEVAKNSGYADAATFNKHFRQFEGLTPKNWLEKTNAVNPANKEQ